MTEQPRRPAVLRHVDTWEELSGQIGADRAVGLSPSRVRDALVAWLDPGSFAETGTLVRRATTSYRGGDEVSDAPNEVPVDGMVAGWGRHRGQLVFVAADDPELGSPHRGAAGAAKAHRMRRHALAQSAPLIQILGAGRVDPDTFIGAEVVRYGYGVDLDFEVDSFERILKIAIVTHPIDGQAALEAGWCHVVILAGDQAAIDGHAGRDAVVAGLADDLCPDLDAALARAGELVAHLPAGRYAPGPEAVHRAGAPPVDGVGPPATEAGSGGTGGGRWAIELLGAEPGPGSLFLATVPPSDRVVVGRLELGPVLDAAMAVKAQRLVRLCAALLVPLVVIHRGWDRPLRPTRSDVDGYRRLGLALAGCPLVIEVTSDRPQVEQAWGLRPTVVVSDGGPGPGADVVVPPGRRFTDVVGELLASLPMPRPRPHEDPRVHSLPPRRLQSE